MFEVLAVRTFRTLFAAQVVALLGTGLLTVALGLLAYDVAGGGAGAVLGTALAIKMVAYVFGAPVMSVVTARVPRRTLLVSADGVRAAIAALLPFVDQPWQIYVLIFVLQAASATFTPAFQSIIPSVLPRERDYTRALSLSRLAYDLESLASPVLAAMLLTVISYNSLFVGTALGFVLSAGLVATTILPRVPVPDSSGSMVQRIALGSRIMLADPVLRALLALNMAVAGASAVVLVNTIVYVPGLLGGSSAGIALALACFGAGSMAAALWVPRLLNTYAERQVMLCGAATLPVGLGVTVLLLVSSPAMAVGWTVLGTAWVLLGAGTSLVNTPAARLIRDGSTQQDRPQVFAAQFSLSHACFLLTYLIAGWVGAQVSQVAAAVALTVIATLATTVAALTWPTAVIRSGAWNPAPRTQWHGARGR
ncbi:MFS transporter [Nocardia sp. 348MFTsu5.1]|uniref:MFS transporter n=1 Tax=Nocardia sp. 348MFTsu5.1 TaxID=1172185 RepID=UPI0003781BA3|nr:MFS transporter [Nocardia sp. 348MFTsu5.1]